MKWLKQIFGVKPEDDEIQSGATDVILERTKFANATKTNELVISPNSVNTSEVKKHTKSTLNKLTKVQLEDLARSDFGLELDRRKKKEQLITEVLNAQ
tara:strand:- start:1759 stop:2052 length:294 start_codon:yes stop_codon:yes gene_type:complete